MTGPTGVGISMLGLLVCWGAWRWWATRPSARGFTPPQEIPASGSRQMCATAAPADPSPPAAAHTDGPQGGSSLETPPAGEAIPPLPLPHGPDAEAGGSGGGGLGVESPVGRRASEIWATLAQLEEDTLHAWVDLTDDVLGLPPRPADLPDDTASEGSGGGVTREAHADAPQAAAPSSSLQPRRSSGAPRR